MACAYFILKTGFFRTKNLLVVKTIQLFQIFSQHSNGEIQMQYNDGSQLLN
jgi:hypothetical protein